jgi:hypothetical protein
MKRPLALCAAVLVVGCSASAAGPASAATRYELAGGCYQLRSQSLGRVVGTGAGPFYMKATALGRYLLYGRRGDFLAAGSGNGVERASSPSRAAEWRVDPAGSGFTIVSLQTGKALTPSGPGGTLRQGAASRFTFQSANGCASFPEVEVNAVGSPLRGPTPYGEVRGFIDAHMHMMAFEFLGGSVHCGRPWHPYGAPSALVDCPDHSAGNGCGAVLENVLYGNPARCHDPVGWPTFKDWPHHQSLTHEQSYYKWLERAWRGGLRVFVNLFVENGVLCELYPIKRNSCDEMTSVRLQARRIRELENYIDAQSGGPGKGWFRIVTSPFEARRVINQGKLAVVQGIEISRLFGCRIRNEVPQCDRRSIDRQLDEVYRLGVRDMELINKFDNALGGVAGDAGQTGVVVNSGNFYETGKFWQLQHCEGDSSDHSQITPHNHDSLVSNGFEVLGTSGAAPAYPAPPHCNTRGLSALGDYLVQRMIRKRMLIDPDHLSVLARKGVLAIAEGHDYSGVVSSHSWSTPDAYPRVYRLGGFNAPYAGSSTSFVEAWRGLRPLRDRRYYFGFGYGADMNGFGAQGGPRNGPRPVRYPFRSFDGGVTIDRQRSGRRVFDINKDGVAHYGLYPDWIQDLRMIAGDQIVRDMARGSEAYLQTWERAEGIPLQRCRAARARFTRRGLGRIGLGLSPVRLLRRAGQPARRSGRTSRYCVSGRRNGKAKVVAVFTRGERVGLVASTARGHRAHRIGRGARSRRLRRNTRSFGRGLRIRRAGRTRIVYRVRRGRVRYVAVASRSVAKSPRRLRAYLRLAGLR